jgi:hypothetical protein
MKPSSIVRLMRKEGKKLQQLNLTSLLGPFTGDFFSFLSLSDRDAISKLSQIVFSGEAFEESVRRIVV